MAFREVSMVQVREVLRLWLQGKSRREVARLVQLDRKTVGRYVEDAEALGVGRGSEEAALSDEFLGQVADAVRPSGPGVRGAAWLWNDAKKGP